MNLGPQNFIGLIDFFSILLPGALLTYLMMGEVGPVVLGDRYATLGGAQAWAAFLFASHLFGHLSSCSVPGSGKTMAQLCAACLKVRLRPR